MKHNDSSETEHMIAVCPECGCVLMECVDCGLDELKPIKWRDCTNGSLLVRQPQHFGLHRGLK